MAKIINVHNLVFFEKLAGDLHKSGSYLGAAEVHGLQSGIICGAEITDTYSFDYEAALIQELNCKQLNSALVDDLHNLYAHTMYQLQSIDFKFDLLLPDDQVALDTRTQALADWCRGFLCGLGLAGVQDHSIVSKMAKEAINDLAQIIHIEAKDDELLEQQENSFFELVEYVKIAVQTIYIDLRMGEDEHAIEHVLH